MPSPSHRAPLADAASAPTPQLADNHKADQEARAFAERLQAQNAWLDGLVLPNGQPLATMPCSAVAAVCNAMLADDPLLPWGLPMSLASADDKALAQEIYRALVDTVPPIQDALRQRIAAKIAAS
jgi:hypothetical protein